MTRFLKRVKRDSYRCTGCIFNKGIICSAVGAPIPFCGTYHIFVLVPRPPDGTRCRDLDGNIKVVGVDV